MQYLLFFIYLLGFCWLIPRIPFFKKSGISTPVLLGLFLIRAFFSVLAAYIALHNEVSDTRTFHNYGIEEYHILLSNPGEFFTNIFTSYSSESYSRFLEITGSFWNDLRSNIIIKMLAIMDIFSGCSLYINSLFFVFFIFGGSVALYRTFIQNLPPFKWELIFSIFLLPSALIFTSFIHRDGLIFLTLSIILYITNKGLLQQRFSIRQIISIFLLLLFILLLRNYVFLFFLPAWIAWMWTYRKPKKSLLIYAGIYATSIILFFCSQWIPPHVNLPEEIVERQQAFIELSDSASTAVSISLLEPNVLGFVKNTPEAFNNSVLRPGIMKIFIWYYTPFVIETFLIKVIFILFLIFRRKNISVPPLIYFCIFFSACMLLITGYIVPILGAIIRYRSVYLIFLLLPMICYTDWEKILKTLRIRKNNI